MITRLVLILWAATLLAGLFLAGEGRLPVTPYAAWLVGLSWAAVRLRSRRERQERRVRRVRRERVPR